LLPFVVALDPLLTMSVGLLGKPEWGNVLNPFSVVQPLLLSAATSIRQV
jgi:hypothetical protein